MFLKYSIFAALSTIKFLFTPMGGPAAELTYFETFLSCLSGGLFSAAVFFYSASFFMKRNQIRRAVKQEKNRALGLAEKSKRKFTRTNRSIISLKFKLGKLGICWLLPLFLSVPIGTIICAKFYKHHPDTFIYIVLGMSVNCAIITGLTYGVDGIFS